MEFTEKKFLNDFINLMQECNKTILTEYKIDNFNIIEQKMNKPTLIELACKENILSFLKKNYLNDKTQIISEYDIFKNYNLDNEPEIKNEIEYTWYIHMDQSLNNITNEELNYNYYPISVQEITVSIGLCKEDEPVFGIVGVPAKNEIYYGIKGIGSFKLDGNKTRKLKIHKKNLEKPELKITTSDSVCENKNDFIQKLINPKIKKICNSNYKLLMIADGSIDIYPEFDLTLETFTCGSHAIIKYAGGTLLDKSTNFEVQYNKKKNLNNHYIAY